MRLTLEAITEISRAIVLKHGHGLELIGVTSTDGGSDRVELLLAIKGCHDGPCRISLNVNRADGGKFEHDLRAKLEEAVREHVTNA